MLAACQGDDDDDVGAQAGTDGGADPTDAASEGLPSEGDASDPTEPPADGGDNDGSAPDRSGRTDAGPAAPGDALPVSGTRLRQRWLRGGSAALPTAIFDTQLDAECAFAAAIDGSWRCMPGGGRAVFYADASCSQAVLFALTADSCDEGPYARQSEDSGECGELPRWRSRVYVAGEPTEPDGLFELLAGECVQSERPDGAAFVSTSELEPDRMVGAQTVVAPVDDVLGLSFWHSDDGGWFPRTPRDLVADRPCTVHNEGPTARPDAHFCVGPTAFADATAGYPGYADGACTKLVGFLDGCDDVHLVARVERIESDYAFRLHEPGPEVESYYTGTPDSCTASSGGGRAGRRYYEVGPRAAGLIAVAEGQGTQSGRLRTLRFEHDGAPIEPPRAFHDSELDLRCDAFHFDDGVLGCVPDLAFSTTPTHFADSGCSEPLVHSASGSSPETSTYVAILADEVDTCFGNRESIRELTGSFGSEMHYVRSDDGSCFAQSVDPAETWLMLGPPLSPGDYFVALSETTD